METTIQVSRNLLEKLQLMKMHNKESYEEIIWDLIEDRMEISDETRENIKISERQIKEGKTISLQKIKNKLGL
jgi:hypothetical protein